MKELKGKNRAEYGMQVIKSLAVALSAEYGKEFTRRELYRYLQFYRLFPEIVDSASPQSVAPLSWTHYRTLLRVNDPEARTWYAHEAAKQNWSVRTLDRNEASEE